MSIPTGPSSDEQRTEVGRYFRYMAEFVGLTEADVEVIRRTWPILEKHLPDVVARFYVQLLRYPPTRRVFLKADGSVDQEYYDITTGRLLADPLAELDVYPVIEREGEIYLRIPDTTTQPPRTPATPIPSLAENEFRPDDLLPGQFKLVDLDGEGVLVCNVDGAFYATQAECPHAYGPLEQGSLEGALITCPLHESRFDVTTGQVVAGPARDVLRTYQVVIDGQVGRVMRDA